MELKDFDFLSDSTEQTSTRYVTFLTPGLKRFDLAVTTTDRFYGKKLVVDLQTRLAAVLGADDLREEGVLEAAFRLSAEEARDLAQFLAFVLDEPQFTD